MTKSSQVNRVNTFAFTGHPANNRTIKYSVEDKNLNIAMPATNTDVSKLPETPSLLNMTSMYMPVRFAPDPSNVADAVFPDKMILARSALDNAHSNSS